jgi:acid stress chaperone HdeB
MMESRRFKVSPADRAHGAARLLQRRKVMTRCMLIVSGVLLFLADGPAARAQVTLDVAKITCDQFTGYKITNPDNIAMWLSGYYNGKRGNTILDTQGLAANTKKVRDYCIQNPQVPVMRAVETVLGADK